MKKYFSGILVFFISINLFAQDIYWPAITTDSKPGSRWWWMGSAVDKKNLSKNLEIYATAGLGSMEITPIYGVQGNDENEIPFLSRQWMDLLKHTQQEATRLGMHIDMNTGTGWPFGGPEVPIEEAASKLIVRKYDITGNKKVLPDIIPEEEKDRPYAKLDKLMAFTEAGKCLDLTGYVKDNQLAWKVPKEYKELIAVFCGKTQQKVKRAAPGGEGYVVNHLDANAVANYLKKFEQAFLTTNTPYPNNFFNDSYEVYGADWTEDFFEQFAKRRGYKLQEHLPVFLSEERKEIQARMIADYRETIAELLLENFTGQWTDWAHKHGAKTRNQAHGSPGNLIDLYATVDIPECEGFGLSDFGITGLRKDSLTRPNDSDISMLKYASSAAHIAGKPFTSSETFTWLTEHFRTSLSQCKPDMDLMFVSGVNRMYFHGTTYSPEEAEWPGWKFYATIDMSPTNSIWRDAPAFFNYISRCQSFLQMGKPDNDFLVYLPVYDMWHEQDGRLLMFDIHSMQKRAPRFIEAVNRIMNAGYDVDYISDQFIRSLKTENNQLITSGGATYKALIIPGARLMPHDVIEKLLQLANEGATIVFLDQYPEDVPGFASLTERREAFNSQLQKIRQHTPTPGKGRILFGTDYKATLAQTAVFPEKMKTEHSISYIRRIHENGYHYFISVLQNEDINDWIPLAVPAQSVMIYDPMTGKYGKARTRIYNGNTEIYLQLASGESAILKTFTSNDIQAADWEYWQNPQEQISLDKGNLKFISSTPAITENFEITHLQSWTDMNQLSEGKTVMGTGHYTFNIQIKDEIKPDTEWFLDLGDVRESARVSINGKEVAKLWAIPYRCFIGKFLKKGNNVIEIDVTNLPANRIAEMDRKGIQWRKFKEINLVDINYKTTGYGHWAPMPGGLLGPVKIYTVERMFNPN